MEGKKSIKDLRARLGVGKDNNASGTPLIPPPGGAPLVPPPGTPPLVPPPGGSVTVSPPLVPPPGAAPLVPPPGVSLPQPPTSQAPAPEPPAPVQPKRIVVSGKIDEETASLAGLDKFSFVKKILVSVLPGLFFIYFGFLVGDLWFQNRVQKLSKTEIETLWKRVLDQNDAVSELEKNIMGVVAAKMSAVTPDKAATDAEAIVKNIDPAKFFPENGLFLPTTPFIDNGKKDTDRRYLGPVLDYIDYLAKFLMEAQLHAELTARNKDKLQAGFDKIRERAKELTGNEDADPTVLGATRSLAKFTQAPHVGFGLELLEGNKGKLVIILDTETETPPSGGDPVISKYTIYDAKFGSTPPSEKDKADAPKTLGKTEVAALDPTAARTFLLPRDTLPVQTYFLGIFRIVRNAEQIIAGEKRAAEVLKEALTAPAPGHGEPSAAPAVPSEPAEEEKAPSLIEEPGGGQ